MVHAGEETSEVSSPGTSAFRDARPGGPAERRRTLLALGVSVVLVAVLIGVVAVVIGLVVPTVPDRSADLEATARRDEFLDVLRATPGVTYVVEPTDSVRSGGYDDAPSEIVDVTVSGTPIELEEVFAALCAHGSREGDQGTDYLFDVATDAAPMTLQCEDPALAGRLTALVDLARGVLPSLDEGVRVRVDGTDVSVSARPAPEAMPEAWQWASRWATGVLDLGLTPVGVRFR
ncbi:hypothetical protein ACFRCR_08920 [Oerskovia sp. NPDC056781]|uniref:hypothetical protein n=1 Tax=Oerskovia sp. NPDC056781 TaxID=3345942 RepID=UPI00366AC7CA